MNILKVSSRLIKANNLFTHFAPTFCLANMAAKNGVKNAVRFES